MDDFDDEPGTGGSYEDAFVLPLYNPDSIPRRIVVRQRNGFERVLIILEEIREGTTGRLIRYDDAMSAFTGTIPVGRSQQTSLSFSPTSSNASA